MYLVESEESLVYSLSNSFGYPFKMALKEVAIYLLIGSAWLTVVNASTEYNRYVTQIFRKYGSGDTINFEVNNKNLIEVLQIASLSLGSNF